MAPGRTRGSRGRGRPRGRATPTRGSTRRTRTSSGAAEAAEAEPKSGDDTPTIEAVVVTLDDAGNDDGGGEDIAMADAPTSQDKGPAQDSAPRAVVAKSGTSASTSNANRFKPKAVRRSQKEREELADQEMKKLDAKAAAEARRHRESARGRRGARGGSRGRGGGRGLFQIQTVAPSGPFSQVPGALGRGTAVGRMTSGFNAINVTGNGSLGFGPGSASASGRRASSSLKEGTAVHEGTVDRSASVEVSSEDFDKEPFFNGNMNADFLVPHHREYLTEYLARMDAENGVIKRRGDLPFTLPRREARVKRDEEPKTPEKSPVSEGKVAPGSNDGSESMWVDRAEPPSRNRPAIVDNNRVWTGVKEIPKVTVDGEEVTTIDGLAALRERKMREKAGLAEPSPPSQPAAPAELPESPESAESMGSLELAELAQPSVAKSAEGAEAIEVDELAGSPESSKPTEKEPPLSKLDIELQQYEKRSKALKIEHFVKQSATERDGQIFWFYIPEPIPLRVTNPGSGDETKAEADNDNNDDVAMTDSASHGPRVDLTNDDEVDDDTAGFRNKKPERKLLDVGETGGFLGKMTVRRSGRTHVDWGGYEFPHEVQPITLRRAAEAVFIDGDDAAHAHNRGRKSADGPVLPVTGSAYGLGKMVQRYVIRPQLKADFIGEDPRGLRSMGK